jgi:excinuclease ABC subunit C
LGLKDIPVISLAEKFEEVYVEGQDDPVNIPKNSAALHLLQRIRDEAHRFALSYHRSLRKKSRLHSVLEEIPGIGEKRRKILIKHFGTVEAIKKSSLEELARIKGMNRRAAQNVLEYLKY